MPTYKLTYFGLRGRGEIIRLIFAEAGVPYEDNRVTFNPTDWSEWLKIKPTTIFGQLPILEVDGKQFCQSTTIARYLARKFNLAGQTELDQFRADMIVDCINDVVEQVVKAAIQETDEVQKAAKIKKFLETDLPVFLTNLDKIHAENNKGDGFFVGNDLTWADISLCILVGFLAVCGGKLDGHPKLVALLKRVESRPKIAAWIAKRPVTPF